MSKIRSLQPKIEYIPPRQQSIEVKSDKQLDSQIIPFIYDQRESLSEMRALRDGIDYGLLNQYETEIKYQKKNGKAHRKGKKKQLKESLEAELLSIIEEQAARTEQLKQELVKDEIKREEITDNEIKQDAKTFENKADDKKVDVVRDIIRHQNIHQQALKYT